MYNRSRNVALASTALWMAACGSVDGEGPARIEGQVEVEGQGDDWAEQDFFPTAEEPSDPALAGAREPLSHPESDELEERSLRVRWFRWTKGEGLKTLMPVSTHICALAMVRGESALN